MSEPEKPRRPLRERVRRAAAWVLGLGLAAGLAIYVLSPVPADDPLDEFAGSKRYLHDLEVYGGKANVLSDEFRRWWDGLWRGKQLGVTVGALAVLVFLATHLVLAQARRPHPASTPSGPSGG